MCSVSDICVSIKSRSYTGVGRIIYTKCVSDVIWYILLLRTCTYSFSLFPCVRFAFFPGNKLFLTFVFFHPMHVKVYSAGVIRQRPHRTPNMWQQQYQRHVARWGPVGGFSKRRLRKISLWARYFSDFATVAAFGPKVGLLKNLFFFRSPKL